MILLGTSIGSALTIVLRPSLRSRNRRRSCPRRRHRARMGDRIAARSQAKLTGPHWARCLPGKRPPLACRVVEFEEVAHLAQPALLHEARMVRVLVVAVVRGPVGELHRDPEAVA